MVTVQQLRLLQSWHLSSTAFHASISAGNQVRTRTTPHIMHTVCGLLQVHTCAVTLKQVAGEQLLLDGQEYPGQDAVTEEQLQQMLSEAWQLLGVRMKLSHHS